MNFYCSFVGAASWRYDLCWLPQTSEQTNPSLYNVLDGFLIILICPQPTTCRKHRALVFHCQKSQSRNVCSMHGALNRPQISMWTGATRKSFELWMLRLPSFPKHRGCPALLLLVGLMADFSQGLCLADTVAWQETITDQALEISIFLILYFIDLFRFKWILKKLFIINIILDEFEQIYIWNVRYIVFWSFRKLL